jgi:hypothetical protein
MSMESHVGMILTGKTKELLTKFKFQISAHYGKLIHRRLKVKRQWKHTVLQRVGSALYRETVEMLLQRNSEVVVSEPHYSRGLL